MKQLHNEDKIKIDVIVTSPPYNINKSYTQYNDNREKNEYLVWIQNVAEKSLDVLKNDGSFFLNIGGRPSDQTLPFEIANRFIQAGYKVQNTIHWIKSISFENEDIGKNNILKDTSIGHFKPLTSKRFLSDLHEYIFHFTKKGIVNINKLAVGVPYQDKTNIKRWKAAGKMDKRDRGNIWFIPYSTIQEKRPHPAVFPKKLPYLCIRLHGIKPKTIVYDPFMGIGTTALACIEIGIDFIGTEIDKNYVTIAEEYLKNTTPL